MLAVSKLHKNFNEKKKKKEHICLKLSSRYMPVKALKNKYSKSVFIPLSCTLVCYICIKYLVCLLKNVIL